MELLIVWVLSAVALLATAYIVPGFEVRNFGAALLGALVLGLANAVLWPLLIILTLPINVLTLGLFTFVVSAAMLKLTAAIVRDLTIDGWGPALLGALVLAVVNTILRLAL
jgi:putative membrane protein